MAEFLSDLWIAGLAACANEAVVPEDLHLIIQQVVLDEAQRECAFTIRIADGSVTVEAGRTDDADVSFTQDRATAAAIARGELSAQAAFMAGQLRVGGDLRVVIDRARELSVLSDVFAAARADTSW